LLDVKELSAAISHRLQLVRATQDEWEVITEVVQAQIAPLIPVEGVDEILTALLQEKEDPLVAAVLVEISGMSDVELPRPGRETLRIDEVFSDEEILSAALNYLEKFPSSGLSDGEWGWTVLWNGWHQLDGAAHLRLVGELIKRAPASDEILTLIADGPVRELTEDEKRAEELAALARDDPKFARVMALVRDRDDARRSES
jgi:hypothetical protein